MVNVFAAALFFAAQPATATAPPPVERLCLLAGPSQSLIALRIVPEGGGYMVVPTDEQVWPFSTETLPLHASSERDFETRDETANLFVRYSLNFADRGGVNLEVVRGVSRREGLPLFGGSCAEVGSTAAVQYLRQVSDATSRLSAADFRSRPLSASRHCHVVSAAGWVSRFSFEFATGSDNVTIHSVDRHLWRSPSITTTRRGMPPHPDPRWVRFAFFLPPAAEIPESINSFWVYATPDGSQSSATASFFGYDPDGPVSGENVAGVCVAFADEGDAA